MAEFKSIFITETQSGWSASASDNKDLGNLIINRNGTLNLKGFRSQRFNNPRLESIFREANEFIKASATDALPLPDKKKFSPIHSFVESLTRQRIRPDKIPTIDAETDVALFDKGSAQLGQEPEDRLILLGLIKEYREVEHTGNVYQKVVVLQEPIYRVIYRHFSLQEQDISSVDKLSEDTPILLTKYIFTNNWEPKVYRPRPSFLRGFAKAFQAIFG